LNLNKICTHHDEGDDNCWLENTVPTASFLKNKHGGWAALGRGFTPKPAGGEHAGEIAGLDHSDASRSGGGSHKSEDSSSLAA